MTEYYDIYFDFFKFRPIFTSIISVNAKNRLLNTIV